MTLVLILAEKPYPELWPAVQVQQYTQLFREIYGITEKWKRAAQNAYIKTIKKIFAVLAWLLFVEWAFPARESWEIG